jgi:long-chain acyl-CoA synthetase
MVNVVASVWEHAAQDPDRIAIRSPRGGLTYGELRDASARVAGAVRDARIGPLDRVVLIAPSVIEFPVVYYGLHAVGASVITMNTMATASEIGYVLDDAEASLVIAWHECADSARAAAAERGLEFWVLQDGAEYDAEPVTEAHDHAPDDTAIILYTSGTTGRPKGVELTASNLIETPASFLPVLNLTAEDRFGTALPLFHVYGQAVIMNLVLVTGASLSLLSPFDPEKMLQMVTRDDLTCLAGVPTMWNAMLHASPESGPADFAHLRLATSGGASLPVEVMRAFGERFDCTILEGYGLTESTGAATFNDLNRPQKVGTTGPALPGTSIEVRDESGAVVGPDVVGRVFLKGPTIMKGYWNRPEITAADLVDGWLDTGDLGKLDADGFLSIVDRAKDLIIRGGYNVYPREVEEVLYRHPEVVEVAVIGVPDPHFGEEVAAVVALSPGSTLTGEELRTWAKVELSAYKVPRLYQFVASLPKGATGKILKREIDRTSIRPVTTGANA